MGAGSIGQVAPALGHDHRLAPVTTSGVTMRHDYRMSEMDLGGGAAPVLRGQFLYNEPMKKHVSWRAGGAAQRVYIPADLEDLTWLVRSVPAQQDIHMVGLGSNLLVRDGGVTGVVILLHGVLTKLAIEGRTQGLPPAPTDIDTALVYAQAGVASPKLARFAATHNLVGGEFWAGIPGTVGGAIAMNAGCYGSETWDKLVQVQTLDRQGQINERLPDEYVTGYRHVALKQAQQEWFIGGWFRLDAWRWHGLARSDQGPAEKAYRLPAFESAECRFGVSQPARRLCRAPDRILRAQGLSHR